MDEPSTPAALPRMQHSVPVTTSITTGSNEDLRVTLNGCTP